MDEHDIIIEQFRNATERLNDDDKLFSAQVANDQIVITRYYTDPLPAYGEQEFSLIDILAALVRKAAP